MEICQSIQFLLARGVCCYARLQSQSKGSRCCISLACICHNVPLALQLCTLEFLAMHGQMSIRPQELSLRWFGWVMLTARNATDDTKCSEPQTHKASYTVPTLSIVVYINRYSRKISITTVIPHHYVVQLINTDRKLRSRQ